MLAEFDAKAPGDFHIACGCDGVRVVIGVGFDSADLDRFRKNLPASFEARMRDSEICRRLLSAEIMAGFSADWFRASNGRVVEGQAMRPFATARDAELGIHYRRAVEISRSLEPESQPIQSLIAGEQWAADELASFGGMLLGPGEFPSPRLGELIARRMPEAASSA